jgi:hypothetical protein
MFYSLKSLRALSLVLYLCPNPQYSFSTLSATCDASLYVGDLLQELRKVLPHRLSMHIFCSISDQIPQELSTTVSEQLDE